MIGKEFFARVGYWCALVGVFLLPWQTRYILWQPTIGTGISEYGNWSLYAVQVVFIVGAVCWWWGRRKRDEEDKGEMEKEKDPDDRKGLEKSFVEASWARQSLKTWRHISLRIALLCILIANILFSSNIPMSLAFLFQIGMVGIAGWLIYQVAQTHRREIILAFCVGLLLPIALGLWQVIEGWSPAITALGLAVRDAGRPGDAVLMWEGQRILRAYGSFGHPNIFGGSLAAGCALLMTLLTQKISSQKERVTLILLFIFLLGGLVLTGSRSAMLGLMVFLLAWWAIRQSRVVVRRILLTVAVVIPLCIWLLQWIAPSVLLIRGADPIEARSINERVVQLSQWQAVMREDGVFGTGIGAYPAALETLDSGKEVWNYQPIHHVLLLVVAEIGIAGVLAGVLCVIVSRLIPHGARARLHPLSPHHILLVPLTFFDHYPWTLWSGMMLVIVLFSALDRRVPNFAKSSTEKCS